MPQLFIRTRSLNLIQASAQPGNDIQNDATAVGSDRWLIEIDDDVADFVETRRLAGESDDAVIERLVTIAMSGGSVI